MGKNGVEGPAVTELADHRRDAKVVAALNAAQAFARANADLDRATAELQRHLGPRLRNKVLRVTHGRHAGRVVVTTRYLQAFYHNDDPLPMWDLECTMTTGKKTEGWLRVKLTPTGTFETRFTAGLWPKE